MIVSLSLHWKGLRMKPIFITIFWCLIFNLITFILDRTSWQYLLYLAHWVRLLAWVLFSILAIALLFLLYAVCYVIISVFFTTQRKRFWSAYDTGQNYKVQCLNISSSTALSLLTLKNNVFLESLNARISITMSNSQVKRTYEATRATALAHHHLPSLGPIKCFGLLQTSVLRLLISTAN